MTTNRYSYISSIERKQAPRLNTSSGYRLDMAERLFDYPDSFFNNFLKELDQLIKTMATQISLSK